MGLTIVSHFSQTYKHTHTGILCVCDLVVYCFASNMNHRSLKKSVEVIYNQLISYSQTDNRHQLSPPSMQSGVVILVKRSGGLSFASSVQAPADRKRVQPSEIYVTNVGNPGHLP